MSLGCGRRRRSEWRSSPDPPGATRSSWDPLERALALRTNGKTRQLKHIGLASTDHRSVQLGRVVEFKPEPGGGAKFPVEGPHSPEQEVEVPMRTHSGGFRPGPRFGKDHRAGEFESGNFQLLSYDRLGGVRGGFKEEQLTGRKHPPCAQSCKSLGGDPADLPPRSGWVGHSEQHSRPIAGRGEEDERVQT